MIIIRLDCFFWTYWLTLCSLCLRSNFANVCCFFWTFLFLNLFQSVDSGLEPIFLWHSSNYNNILYQQYGPGSMFRMQSPKFLQQLPIKHSVEQCAGWPQRPSNFEKSMSLRYWSHWQAYAFSICQTAHLTKNLAKTISSLTYHQQAQGTLHNSLAMNHPFILVLYPSSNWQDACNGYECLEIQALLLY